MTIETDITADQQALADAQAAQVTAVAAAQAAVDAAAAKLADDQAKLAAVQPHLDILTNIENELAAAEAGIGAGIVTAFDAAKAQVTSLIEQMRALFLGQ